MKIYVDKECASNFQMEYLAEFIGIMLGDGSIGIYDTRAGNRIKEHWVLKVTLDSRNKNYINYVAKLIGKVLEEKPIIYKKSDCNAVDICIFKRNKISYVLNEIGLKISPKWNRMEIPPQFMKKEFYPSILRGLFDTDGSVTIFNNNGIIYPRIEIRICPSPAQKQFIEIVNSLGFNYKVQNNERGKIRIRISGKKELQRWFDIVGSSNQDYINRANQFLQKKPL